MKKLMLFFVLIIFLIPIVSSELSDDDLKKVEAVVRREVQSSNDKLRDDLKADIENVRTEVNNLLEDISGSASTTKTILVLAVAGIVIVAETFISFLKFLIWRLKRKLDHRLPKVPKPAKQIQKLKVHKPKTRLDKEKEKYEMVKEKLKREQERAKIKAEIKLLKKRI